MRTDTEPAARPTRSGSPRTLLHVFSTFDVGGPQVRFADLANHFGRRYRHLILAMDGAYGCSRRLSADVDCEFLNISTPKRATLRNVWNFRDHLKRLQPDLLLTYNWGAIEWGMSNSIPVCPHVHLEDGFGPDEAAGQMRRRVLLRRLVLARATRVVVPSRTLYRIARCQWRIPERRLSYLPNGIDCERFQQVADDQLLRELHIGSDRPLIGTVARLRPEKNIGRLLRAFATVRRAVSAHLLIVGEGPEQPGLQQWTRELGLTDSVTFAGQIERPEHVLGTLDVFAVSSDTEQMPYSVIEAMAAGLPIAAVDAGDIPHMVSTANRPFIVRQDADRLAEAILGLLQDPSRREMIGLANRERAHREFGLDTFLSAYEQIFETGRSSSDAPARGARPLTSKICT